MAASPRGALIECGVIDGVGLADFYMAVRAAAEFLSGINLFEAPDRESLVRRVSWLPFMGTPPAYTSRGRRFDSVLKYLMGGDLPLRLQGMPPYYLRDVIPEAGPDTRELLRAASTVHVRYQIDPGLGVSEEDLNKKIRRIVPPEIAVEVVGRADPLLPGPRSVPVRPVPHVAEHTLETREKDLKEAAQRRGDPRLRHRGLGEELADVGVDVLHPVLGGDLDEVADPLDPPRLLELRPGVRGHPTAREAIAAVVDDEVELRPVLRPHVAVWEQVRGNCPSTDGGKRPLWMQMLTSPALTAFS